MASTLIGAAGAGGGRGPALTLIVTLIVARGASTRATSVAGLKVRRIGGGGDVELFVLVLGDEGGLVAIVALAGAGALHEGGVAVDLVDPHNHSLADTAPKWSALARYVREHDADFRRASIFIKDAAGDLLAIQLS